MQRYFVGRLFVSGMGLGTIRLSGPGAFSRHDEPDQLRRGIEDNLRGLGVAQLAAVSLRLGDDATPDTRFDDQLAAMTQARDEGLIGGVGRTSPASTCCARWNATRWRGCKIS